MNRYSTYFNRKETILALGAESAGNFSIFHNNNVYHSSDFGDLQIEENFQKFKDSITEFIQENNIQPEIILTDLHPSYVTTELGQELSQKFDAEHIQIQHHHAHAFASIGDFLIHDKTSQLPKKITVVTMDGTGFGLDEKIWGGEIFNISTASKNIKRIGYLENQILLGSELAIREPARILISILSKFLPKDKTFEFIKNYYNQNQFELLHSQLQQNFNCQETSSTGRILDAVSLLLGFSQNSRDFKHAPIKNLETNSTIPYSNIKPEIIQENDLFILKTTPLFEYLVKNINKDQKRLAATAQQYLAEGFYEIINKTESQNSTQKTQLFISGGVANSKIISDYFHSKKSWKNKKVPRGDAGLSLGQIFCHLFKH
ncbi:hypothetical protein ACFL08_01160 [Patescibacteria group bacterium]